MQKTRALHALALLLLLLPALGLAMGKHRPGLSNESCLEGSYQESLLEGRLIVDRLTGIPGLDEGLRIDHIYGTPDGVSQFNYRLRVEVSDLGCDFDQHAKLSTVGSIIDSLVDHAFKLDRGKRN